MFCDFFTSEFLIRIRIMNLRISFLFVPLVIGTDPRFRIRIRTTMARIPNTSEQLLEGFALGSGLRKIII
jgi:hypothetical protein